MLVMTGKEIFKQKNQIATQIECATETEDKKIVCNFTSSQGDTIQMVFTSPKRAVYAKFAELVWTKLVSSYQLLDGDLVYLVPKDYWTIYKKYDIGKNFLTLIGSKMYINNRAYTFPTTDFYFDAAKMPSIRGVYGIYKDDYLLYIGSAADVETRWREHDENFRTGNGKINSMYNDGRKYADELEYRVLLDSATMQKDLGIDAPSMWLFELVEYGYIKLLQPHYNRDGVVCRFSFKARPGDLPIDYWSIMRKLLTDSYYSNCFEEAKKFDGGLPPEPISFDDLAGIEEEIVEIEIEPD